MISSFGAATSTATTPTTTLVWGMQAPLPLLSGSGTTTLNDVACFGSTCTAVGFLDDGVSTSALVASDSTGQWAMSTLPTTLSGSDAQFSSVSCDENGCTAVGSFDNGTNSEAFAASNSTGSWIETAIPTTLAGTPDVWLTGASCTSAGCTAVGYSNDGTSLSSFIASNTSGSWVETPLLRATNGSDGDQLSSVSCTASDCVAVGTLTATDPSTYAVTTKAFWTSASNNWTEELLSTVSPEIDAQLTGISCTESGCTAVGSANDNNGTDTEALVATESAGTWTEQVVPNQISGAVNTELSSVSCNAQACELVGSYLQATHQIPFSLSNGSGTWTPAVVPFDEVGSDAGLNGVACITSTTCVAVGAVVTASAPEEFIALSAAELDATQLPADTATLGVPYVSHVDVSGGVGATTYSVTSGHLPSGITLDGSTGRLSGTPRSVGSTSFDITATNGGPPSQTLDIPVTITVGAVTHPVALAATGMSLWPIGGVAVLLLVLGGLGVRSDRERREVR